MSRRVDSAPCYRSWVASPAKAGHGSPPTTLEDDAQLIGRIRGGDTAAMGVVYDRHAPGLFAIALRMLGAVREAEDLLHDVFLEAWQHVREYDRSKGSVHTWLVVRLRSRALDRLGRAEARRTRSLEESAESAELSLDASSNVVDGIAVRGALTRLEADVRKVLELTYFDGLTAREIAEQMAVPVGTVRSRLARGLTALEALLSTKEGS